jgi:hypothetical protein
MFAEVTNVAIPWTEPRDVDLDVPRYAPNSIAMISSKHFSGNDFFSYSPNTVVYCAMADASKVCFSSSLVTNDRFADLLKIGGWQQEFSAWPLDERIHWPHCMAFAVWVVSSGWLLVRAVRSRKKASVPGGEEAQGRDTIAGS